MGILILWLCGSALAFALLWRAAIRDFGGITRAGLIGLISISAIAPAGILAGLTLTLIATGSKGGFWSKQVWPKDRQGNGR